MKKTLFTLLIFTLISTPTFFIYGAEPVKILLVPGHDEEVWGSQYGNIKEADMNLRLATELLNILKKDNRFEVHITRDSLGYTTEFADYFANAEEIIAFKENAKKEFQQKVSSGVIIEKKDTVYHNAVTSNVATILYGINKWASENNMDAVIHIHFNDYVRPTKWTRGVHKGFVIYMPEEQMVNSAPSVELGKRIFTELLKKYFTSTLPQESGGLIKEQSLIALGSNGTLLSTVRSVLIEYGYIYRFSNTIFRRQSYKTMADLTAKGINNYFFNSQILSSSQNF